MEYSIHIQNEVSLLAAKKFNHSEKDNFFTQVYPKFNIYDQAKIIKLFQKDMVSFIHYLNNSKEKSFILEQLSNGIIQILKEEHLEKVLDLLPIVLAYLNLDDPSFHDELIAKIFEKIEFFFESYIPIEKNIILDILECYTKLIAYSSPNKEMYKQLLKGKNFEKYEKVICSYIEKVPEEEMIDNELINLLIEIAPSISSLNIRLSLKNKFSKKIILSKYENFIENMLPMDENVDAFFVDVKKYRIQNGIIPENICVYINKFYGSQKELLRLCNIDYIRHYLIRNGVENISVFYDYLMEFGTKGLASPTFLALKVIDLSIVMFHEATHVIQYNNQQMDTCYIKYYYSMLKDNILHQKLDPIIYNRNHNRYLFEIDADIRGENEYYNFLEYLGLLSEEDKEKRKKLEEKEMVRLSLSNCLNIDGYNYEKGEIFDSILSKNIDLLEKYPILQIEYDQNGDRKNMIEILKSLESALDNHKRSEEEIISIAGCIFGESYEVSNISSLLEQLRDFIPTSKIILEIKKDLIRELEIYNNQNIVELKDEENTQEIGRKN